MIGQVEALKQARRLLTLNYASDTPELVTEWAAALQTCITMEHCRRVVDEILRTHIDRVSPAQLYDEISRQPVSDLRPYPGQCGTCGGLGFVFCTIHSAETGDPHDAVRRCKACHPAITRPRDDTADRWRQEGPKWHN